MKPLLALALIALTAGCAGLRKTGTADVEIQSGTNSVRIRQPKDTTIGKLIWNIPELIADLSKFYHLQPGDLIFTGTPEGVGPVLAGDRIEGHIEGVGSIVLHVGPAE